MAGAVRRIGRAAATMDRTPEPRVQPVEVVLRVRPRLGLDRHDRRTVRRGVRRLGPLHQELSVQRPLEHTPPGPPRPPRKPPPPPPPPRPDPAAAPEPPAVPSRPSRTPPRSDDRAGGPKSSVGRQARPPSAKRGPTGPRRPT